MRPNNLGLFITKLVGTLVVPLIAGAILLFVLQRTGNIDGTPVIVGITVALFAGGVLLGVVHFVLLMRNI